MSWDSDIPDWVRSSSDILAYTWARSQPPVPGLTDAQRYIPQDPYEGGDAWNHLNQMVTSSTASVTSGYVPTPSASTPLARPPTAYPPNPSPSGGHPSTPSFSSALPTYAASMPGWSSGAHSYAGASSGVSSNSTSSSFASLPYTPARHPPISATVPISAILPEVRQRLVSQPLSSVVQILGSIAASWPPERKGRLVAALTENWSTQHASLIFMALVPIGVPLSRPAASSSAPFAQMSNQASGPAGDFFDGFARATPPTRLQQVLACIPQATPLPVSPPSSGSGPPSSLHIQSTSALGKMLLGLERRARMRQLSELAHSQLVSGQSQPSASSRRSPY